MNEMEKYTIKNWDEDGCFRAKVGQFVDHAIVEEMVGDVPPLSWPHKDIGHISTMGEPVRTINIDGTGQNTYNSFVYIGEDTWVFLGPRPVRK